MLVCTLRQKHFRRDSFHKNTSGSVPSPPWDPQICTGITIISSKNLEIHFLFISCFVSLDSKSLT